ncbi:5882_t:CDS:1, partial [Dentiscutata erythropus]
KNGLNDIVAILNHTVEKPLKCALPLGPTNGFYLYKCNTSITSKCIWG